MTPRRLLVAAVALSVATLAAAAAVGWLLSRYSSDLWRD